VRDCANGISDHVSTSLERIIARQSERLDGLNTFREAYRKVNHFHLKPMENLYSSCGGCWSYAMSRPVIALEIRTQHMCWVPRFSCAPSKPLSKRSHYCLARQYGLNSKRCGKMRDCANGISDHVSTSLSFARQSTIKAAPSRSFSSVYPEHETSTE
jgi:hypothetical protein